MGRGAGPSKLTPSGSYPEPWQGHLNLFSLAFQSGVHPRCVQMAEITKMPSVLRTTQMRCAFWNLVSTPKPKSDGYPIVKVVFGSYSARGRKKRRNITKFTPRNPSTDAITKRRRRAISLDSSVSSGPVRILAIASPRPGLRGFCGGAAAPAGFSAVGFDMYAPWTPRGGHRSEVISDQTVYNRRWAA